MVSVFNKWKRDDLRATYMGIPRRKRLPKLEEFRMFDDSLFTHLFRR